MKALTGLTLLIILPFIGCSIRDNKNPDNETQIQFTHYSESVRDTFHINIQLPREYFNKTDKKYPIAFFIDGNFYFPMMSSIISQYEIAGLLEPMIVVGVGYKSFKTMDSLRVRDCLYPKALPSDEINAVGGGQNFYNYLTKELIPKIDSNYRTQKNNRALLGHSFGGYFVLYSLLNQLQNKNNNFKTFVSASPTLWYNNFYLKQLPEELNKNGGPIGVFVSVGNMEDSTWSVNPVKDLSTEIQRKNIKELEFRSRIYNHLDHMDVAVLSFTMGLQELMNDKRETN